MKGDTKEFDSWYKKNSVIYDEFIEWFRQNPLKINNENKFIRYE